MDDICTACLCTGRKLSFIEETGAYSLYSQILNEIPVYDFSQICIRVCWECRALLRRFQRFKRKVKRSYTELLQLAHQDSSTKLSIVKPPDLQIRCLESLNYPLCDADNASYPDVEVKTELDELPEAVDDMKFEVEEHCEPETFVNDLDVRQLRRKRPVKKTRKKKDKDKTKKKVKKKRISSESVNLDDNDKLSHLSDISDLGSVLELYDEEKDEVKVEDKLKEKKDKIKKKIDLNEKIRVAEVVKDSSRKLSIEPPDVQIRCLESLNYPLCDADNASYRQVQVKPELDELEKFEVKEHCEPETFVNDLDVGQLRKKHPVKKTRTKKDKDKTKKKVKKKRMSSESVNLDDNVKLSHLSDVSDLGSVLELYDEEKDEGKVEDKLKEKKDKIKKKIDLNEKIRVAEVVKTSEMRNGVYKRREKEDLGDKPQCVECGKMFSSKKTYRYHLEVLHKGHNRYPCPRCEKVYQWKSNLGRHLRSHKARDNGELYCELCDKRFASVATYRQHVRTARPHLAEHQYSFHCNECGKKFASKTRLRDHIDWEHLKKIKFRCQLCNKPFKSHTSLYVHAQNVHRDKEKKENLCHVCGKSYQNGAKLKYHITAMHSGETPYRCAHCAAAFGWYSSLYRHVREVHYKMKLQPKKARKTKKQNEALP